MLMCETIEPNLQGILNAHLETYRRRYALSDRQRQVCLHIQRCRTVAQGVGQHRCDQCTFQASYAYACRDRHCPGCQHQATRQWCERQRATALPVHYHHLVFTLPSDLNPWVARHDRIIYAMLFRCVWHTMNRFGHDAKRLNGQIGMSSVLHTWGENLSRHVHLHCLVPGGALNAEGLWKEAPQCYLFPVRALSRHFRGSFVSALRQAFKQGELSDLSSDEVNQTLNRLMQKEWVIYSKPVPGGPGRVIDYLGRYSHRIAISNARIRSVDTLAVSFDYKDYRENACRRTMQLDPVEFIRRYLLHVLPKGLMRIRHYGLLANCCRPQLAQLRGLLIKLPRDEVKSSDGKTLQPIRNSTPTPQKCPRCLHGTVSHHQLIPRTTTGRVP